MRKKVAGGERAIALLSDVVTSIEALRDEDLLDLADIFSGDACATLGMIASTEMKKRNLSL